MIQLRVLAAAFLFNNGESDDPRAVPTIVSAPPPARHHNLFALTWPRKPDAQGFLLSDGTFADRKRALLIAHEAGQIVEGPNPDGCPTAPPNLYSEDLW